MTSIFHDAFFSILSQLVPYVLAGVAIIAVTEFHKLVKWFDEKILPLLTAFVKAHASTAEREAFATLARMAVIAARNELAKNPDADVLKIALAFFNAHMSKYGLSLSEDAIIAAIKDAEAKLAAEQNRPVIKALAI